MADQENISVVVENSEVPASEPVSTEPSTEPVKVEETTTTTPVTVKDRAVAIPLSTVVRCSNLVENLSRRGVFRANEMAEVGALYNILAQVVNNGVNQIRAEQVLPKEETAEASEEVVSTDESS